MGEEKQRNMARPDGPGSREPSPAVSALTGFDPSRDNRPPRQFYEQAESMDSLIWRVCEYRRDDCERCAPLVDFAVHGECKPGCRALAEEMAALVLASASGMSAGTAETQSGSGPQDRQPDGEAGTPKAHDQSTRIAELEEALRPFSELGKMLVGTFPEVIFRDDELASFGAGKWIDNGVERSVTYGDFRRASSVLSKGED